MKRARLGILTAAVLAVASVAFAQAKPDFSGTWTLDASASPAAGTGGGGAGARGGGMGGPMTVKQTADTLTIERTRGENKTTTTYKLDGTESTNSMPGREGATMEVKSVAKWDGDKLSITTKRPGQDGAIQESTETWSIDGGNLTIERTGGRGPSKQVYKKTT
jgi:hypothetical protein